MLLKMEENKDKASIYFQNGCRYMEHFEEYVFNSFAIKIEFKECREYFSKKINAWKYVLYTLAI